MSPPAWQIFSPLALNLFVFLSMEYTLEIAVIESIEATIDNIPLKIVIMSFICKCSLNIQFFILLYYNKTFKFKDIKKHREL